MVGKQVKSKAGRPSQSDSDETRRTILSAAMICFSENGFGSTSTRTIAERAGVNVALIYHYFKNKNALFLEAYHEIQTLPLSMARENLESATSLTSGWSELCEKIYSLHIERPEIARFNAVVEVEAARNPDLEKVLYDSEWLNYFQQLARLAVKNGEVDADREQELVQVLAIIMQGIARRSLKVSAEDFRLSLQGMIKLFEGSLIHPTQR